jgi:tRNA(fMet)-specific endonuclease VapC
MSWFLDTNICIGCLRGTTPLVVEVLRGLEPSHIKIPSIVKAELLHGAQKSADPRRNRELVDLFLAPFETVPFNGASAEKYVQIIEELDDPEQPVSVIDLIIAATVLAHQGTLVSSDTDEFMKVRGLPLENWAEASLWDR